MAVLQWDGRDVVARVGLLAHGSCRACVEPEPLPEEGFCVEPGRCPRHRYAVLRFRDGHGAVTVLVGEVIAARVAATARPAQRLLDDLAVEDGFTVPAAAMPLLRQPLSFFADHPQDMAEFIDWCLIGFTVDEAIAGRARGLSVNIAAEWARVLPSIPAWDGATAEAPPTAREVLAWHYATPASAFSGLPAAHTMSEAAGWFGLGARTPGQRPKGTSQMAARHLKAAGWPITTPWEGPSPCADVALRARERGASIEQVWALTKAVQDANPVGLHEAFRVCDGHREFPDLCLWSVQDKETAIGIVEQVPLGGWGDAGECLGAGMSVAETVRFLTSGGDMTAVRVAAALLVQRSPAGQAE